MVEKKKKTIKKGIIKSRDRGENREVMKRTSRTDKATAEIRFGRSNLVIGLTGPFGSGCSKMLEVLSKQEFGFRPFKISDYIREELKGSSRVINKGKPGWRKVLQDHGNKRRQKDIAYWVNKVIDRIDKDGVKEEDIVIDGFRNFGELQEIRKIYP